MASLVGKWKLVREGSDIMPGLENMPGAPLVLRLLGDSTAEFYKIEKKKILDVEEISLSYVVKNASINKSIQVGTINFEHIASQEVTLSMIQNVDENFREFSFVRLGPKCGQNSKETYTLDSSLNKVKLQVEITADDGTRLNLIKYLTRFEASPVDEVVLKNCVRTQGWKIFEFWPSTILTGCKISIVRALKIKTQASTTNETGKVVDTVWSKQGENGSEDNIDLSGISRQFGYQQSDGEEVVEFVVKVLVGDVQWVVAHRYKEFDALRRFLLIQNPHVKQFQECDARFPGKVVGLTFRRAAMDQRVEGLEAFLVCFLENSRYCRQNSIDAICSFLKIPENMFSSAKSNAAAASSTAKLTTVPVAPPVNGSAVTSQPLAVTKVVEVPTPPVASKVAPVVPAPAKAAPTASASVSALFPPPAPLPIVAPPVVNTTKPAPSATMTMPSSSSSSMSDSVSQTISSSTARAQQVARENLYRVLEKGLTVLKYGRHGAPKNRTLQCDVNVSKLFWHHEDKAIQVADISEIRMGSDVDVAATSPIALEALKNTPAVPSLQKKKSLRQSILMAPVEDENTVYFGTANLRRCCKPENMHMCLSLILPDRTFDIQCTTLDDLDLLHHNLKILLKK